TPRGYFYHGGRIRTRGGTLLGASHGGGAHVGVAHAQRHAGIHLSVRLLAGDEHARHRHLLGLAVPTAARGELDDLGEARLRAHHAGRGGVLPHSHGTGTAMKSCSRLSIALALGALAVIVPARGAQAQVGIAVGAQAPGAAVETLDGKSVNLSQFIGKKPVMMTFWATWCTNCKELEPQFLSLVKQYSPRVTFIDVAVSVNQSADRVKRYAEK